MTLSHQYLPQVLSYLYPNASRNLDYYCLNDGPDPVTGITVHRLGYWSNSLGPIPTLAQILTALPATLAVLKSAATQKSLIQSLGSLETFALAYMEQQAGNAAPMAAITAAYAAAKGATGATA